MKDVFVVLNSVASSLDAQEVTLSEKLRSKCLGPWTSRQEGRKVYPLWAGRTPRYAGSLPTIGRFFPYNSGILILQYQVTYHDFVPQKMSVGNEVLRMNNVYAVHILVSGISNSNRVPSFVCIGL